MVGALRATDRLLHDLGRPGAVRERWAVLALAVLLAGPVYGATMGSYDLTRARSALVMYAAIKVPLLIFATTGVCLPGFFVLNTVAGLRDDFGRAMRAILSGQAAMTLALASLAPITRVFYFSGATHRGALLFSAAMFTLATAAAQLVMVRKYRALTGERERGGRHRLMLWLWVGLYAFVGIQMGWMLRPFVGSPGLEPAFFRPEPFTNAYEVVYRLIVGQRD